MNGSTNIKDTTEAVKGIVEAIPVYQDIIQPAAKEIGKNLETVAKTIQIALAPVSALVWGFDKIKDFVISRVSEKLKDIPSEQILTPSPHIVAPTLEALRYTAQEESLRELYANLLATSLDAKTAHRAHPAFVDIIKNLSPDEARLLQVFVPDLFYPVIDVHLVRQDNSEYFILLSNFSLLGHTAKCLHLSLVPNYLDNLCRLGLTEIPSGISLTHQDAYIEIENDTMIKLLWEQNKDKPEMIVRNFRKAISLTRFGKQFCQTCINYESLKT